MHFYSNKLLRLLDPATGKTDEISPQHPLSSRSNYDISDRSGINLWVRYNSKITFYDISGYVTMDSQWRF